MSKKTESDTLVKTKCEAGKYLSFKIGEEVYGVAILKVQEIIGIVEVIKIPKTPAYIRGVINLRDNVIPIIDLRTKFSYQNKADNEKTCIIVVQFKVSNKIITTGVIVDEVSEVLNIEDKQIEEPPSFGEKCNTDFIIGVGKIEEKVIMLLDMDKVLSEDEQILIKHNSIN